MDPIRMDMAFLGTLAEHYNWQLSIYAGLGAGIGAGIDALVGGTRTVYRRGTAPSVTVAPTVRRNGGGVSLAVRW